MANYRKSFNLRNGVQVDEDNFLVNANGLVGIGTSVPTETLDVRGSVKVVGTITADTIIAPNVTVTGITTLTQLNVGITSIKSGIITASSGIVTYYGDGKGLVNIPTSQWVDVNTGTGYSSIYAAGSVGIATTMPYYLFQVGGSPDIAKGIGISSSGDVKTTGIITATSFVGYGSDITLINASNISLGTLSNNRLPTIDNSKLPSNISVSGVITATNGFFGSLTGIAQSASSLTGNPNINVDTATATVFVSGFSTIGISTITNAFHVGTGGTAFSALSSGRIGVGTALPSSEFQIRKSSSTLLEVLSDNSEARISIGQSVGVGKSTAVLRFGNSSRTFDILNNDIGNVNMYLHAGLTGPVGVNTGRFEWLYGQTNAQLMSLTYGGRLGLGKTNPDETLHVVGTSTVTSNAWFGNNVTVKGTLSAASLSIPSITGNLLGNVYSTSGISTFNNVTTSGNITVSTGSSIGIGTLSPIVELDLREKNALIGYIGVGTNKLYGQERLSVTGTFILPNGGVGIGTTQLSAVAPFADNQIYGQSIDFDNSSINIKTGSTVGFNTYIPKSVLDFSNVGSATTRPVMVVPNISTSTRNGIGQTPAGSMIFNTNTLKFQGYTGIAWTDFH